MKKLLSLLLIVTMLFTSAPMIISADEESSAVTVYVTVSKYGEFVCDTDRNTMALIPMELTGNASYTLDDLFVALHEEYCPDGYASAEGDYGAYITMLWGDTSGNFGYQVNGGTKTVMGLTHEIENGDYVDALIYKNYYPETETYTKFDKYEAGIYTGEQLELTLSQAGYDENWNTVFSACENAIITVDGEETENVTDSEGYSVLTFDEPGTYLISARKTKELNEQAVPAITAPVCKVTVKEHEYIAVIHNIAEKYSQSGVSSDENMQWLIADMAVYNELYPQNENTLSDNEKQKCLDKIIEDATDTTAPSNLSKDILALRALGYDAKKVYDSKSGELDIVSKLTKLVDSRDGAVTSVYTLPYVIIALRQGEGYATEEQMKYLVDYAVSVKSTWQNDEWGTDAATAMILALAPYYNTDEDVKIAIDEAVEMVISAQDETGIINNAASTGIAITAFSALATDAQTVICNENSLIDGLMTQSDEELTAFNPLTNSFSTEQGFRGLLAWQLLTNETGKIMYDFSSYPMDTAYATKKTYSSGGGSGGGSRTPVKDNTEDETEESTSEEKTEETEVKETEENILPIVSPGKTFGDINGHKNQAKIEALAERNIINGKTENTFEPDATMTRAEFATIITRALKLTESETAIFKDVTKNDWFYTYINTAYSNGIIKGVSETEFNPNGAVTRQEAAVMLTRAAKLCGMDTEINEDDARNILSAFTDYINTESWAKESMAFCYGNGILPDEDIEILPANKAARAEVAEMIYNMLNKSGLLQEESN